MPLTSITVEEETKIFASLNFLTEGLATESFNDLIEGKYLKYLNDNIMMRKAYDRMLTRDGYNQLMDASGARGPKTELTNKINQKLLDYYMRAFIGK